jgi:trans-AT polyketide synthase, acyltransferase and oxidoreductase domains
MELDHTKNKMVAVSPKELGNASFKTDYGVKYAYMAGAMANAISSKEMVIALGKAGYLASFGSGGLTLAQIKKAIKKIRAALPNGPYVFNLLHNPSSKEERKIIEMYLQYNVRALEAAAFRDINSNIVYYRAAGLQQGDDRNIVENNRIIAKVSRPEVAEKFMKPAPGKILRELVGQGLVSPEQAKLASRVPVANDVTVEADSGGHTDNGSLVCLFPAIQDLRDEIQKKQGYKNPIRVGAAGGIGTPHAALAAFMMGADYIVTGSVNQSCVEAGTSGYVKNLLAQADMTDTAMAPSADMFEIGAKVRVLKRGALYPQKARKLYQLYEKYPCIEDISENELKNIETRIFRMSIEEVWEKTVKFFQERDPGQISRTEGKPKKKMALIFRWYLGSSSMWAKTGEPGRKEDYQIWCGQCMGAFNNWVKGAYLEKPENRSVVDVAYHLMKGAAYLYTQKSLERIEKKPGCQYERYIPRAKGSVVNQPKFDKKKGDLKMGKLDFKKSKEVFKEGKNYLPGGVHYNFGGAPEPFVVPFNKGKGSRVWDLDGNEHLDLFCKFGGLIVGHCHPEYNEALKKCIDRITSVNMCDLEGRVCEMITHYVPCAEMVRFGLSGTESVQNAIRLGRAYSGKNRFIRFAGHYHGNADNIMGGKFENFDYPVPKPYKGDILDTEGRAAGILEEQSFILPWNDIDALESTIEKYADEIGVIIMEPICVNGGGVLPKPGYMEKVREICDRNHIVLIFDEVITGFRVGLGGAQTLLGVTPDIAVYGKAIAGGGVPVSAIAGKKEIMNLLAKGKVLHLGTFNGYPLGLAAILATLELLSKDTECYKRMGDYLIKIGESLIGAAKNLGMPMVVQGMPTVLLYHSQENPVEAPGDYTDLVKFQDMIIRATCQNHGILFSPISRFYSTLMTNDDDLQFFNDRIGDALTDAKKVIQNSGFLMNAYDKTRE